jgi:signal transduction histidine kinase/ligand-binding sensor domain-containing protein
MTDRAGSLWIGSRHSGLGRLRNGRFEALVAAQGLTDNAVLSLFEDREGSLWIGTVGGGLNRLRDTPFLTLGTAEGLSGGLFSALLEGRDGSLWVGSIGSGALQRIHDGKVTQFGKKEGLTSDVILSLAEGPAGVLWVGTDSGLNQVKKGVLRTFTKKQGLLSNVVFSLLEGRDGSLWIGTLHGGIDHLKDGRITSFAKAEGLQNDQVHCLLEGREGDLWIGTRGGLSHLKNGIISTVATRKELGAEAVFALFEDTDGALWIGTEGGGLARLLEGKIASITTKAGLFHDTVFTILDDGLGHFWMSCNKGVFRASKRDLAAVANGSTRTLKCIPYGIPDGMLSAECNGGIQPAGWKARDGRLWFPTTRGLAMVDPTQVGMNTLPPPVHIEAVQVDQESMDLSRPVRIPPGRHNLDIRYTALSFLVPGRVRFKYRLEGFDPEWVEAGTRRTAYYTHLPPGTFRFRVLACNNDGVWNLEGAALAFKVEPHFYQTWLFYGLCAVAAVVSGALVQRHFQRVRIHNLEMENRVLDERHRLARDVHDQLSQTMTGVVLQLEAASHALTLEPARCRPYMDRAMQLAREGMAETRRTIKGLRATVLDQGDLRHALESIGPQLTDGTGVRVEVRQEGSPFPLSSRTEDNLFRVGQEAITNALRHGRTHQIEIVLKWEDRGVRLTIHDHGRGMEAPLDPSSPSRGLGLGGMRDRISADHGTLTVGNSPEGGARVEAFVPRRDS